MNNHPLHLFRFCPQCGAPAFEEKNGKAKNCRQCGFTYYFNPSSAVVAVIINEKDELLVARRANEPAKGTFDLPGGFVDMYETVEEGMSREVIEETGLIIHSMRYLFCIPNIYVYSGFEVHTTDLFFECNIRDFSLLKAQDDVSQLLFIPLRELQKSQFGLASIRKGIEKLQKMFI